MSGIAGLFTRNTETVSRSALETMARTLRHRGPDGTGLWCEAPVGLSHQHLITTPESRFEDQPLRNEEQGLALVADARIDNRESLLKEFGLETQGEESITDPELILRAYNKWGENCPEHLIGAFSFALWDQPKEKIVCGRDRFGVKPFYYHHGSSQFAFGSEQKAILSLPNVSRTVDEVRIGQHLAHHVEDTERTFYEAISRLPPAHILTVNAEGLEKRRYWSLNPDSIIELSSDEAYAEAFRERFAEAVKCRLRSVSPVGTMLSGGLDSSSITCTAREHLPVEEDLYTYSATFSSVPSADELDYIQSVLDSGNYTPQYIAADEISPLLEDGILFTQHDDPAIPPNHFMHWALYREAGQTGNRVMLDGIDGDTTVSHGQGYMAELARRGRFFQLLKEIRGFASNFERSKRRVLFNRVLAPNAPKPIRMLWYNLPGRDQSAGRVPEVVDEEFAKRIDLRSRIESNSARNNEYRVSPREKHYQALSRGLIPLTFEKIDIAAAKFGVEPRYPFFDKRLVEFCLALPTEQKIQHGWTRVVLRRAMDGILPEPIQWRGDKSDLSPNFYRSLLHHEQDRIRESLESPGPISEYVNDEFLLAEWEAFKRSESPKNPSEDVMGIWSAMTLGLWLQGTN